MKITQITFIDKNPKCVSNKPKRYLINTSDKTEALEEAEKLLREEKHFDRYRALPAITINVHDV